MSWMVCPDATYISQVFGPTDNPLEVHCPQGLMHTGVDLAAPLGSPVFTPRSGTVIQVGEAGPAGDPNVAPDFGPNAVVLLTDDNAHRIYFGHLSRADVAPGQHVAQGCQIGAVGTEGVSTGPHLHLEVEPNWGHAFDCANAEDPTGYLNWIREVTSTVTDQDFQALVERVKALEDWIAQNGSPNLVNINQLLGNLAADADARGFKPAGK